MYSLVEGPDWAQVPNPGSARFLTHLMNTLSFLTASTTTTTSSTTGSGSSSLFLVVIIALVAAFYFLMIRPNQRRRMQAMRQSRAYEVGDEVVAGGMVGHVVRVGEGEVDVEVANGVTITFVPQAVQSRASYAAGPAARGLGAGGARGFGGAGMGGAGMGGARNSSSGTGSRTAASNAWPSDDDGPELNDGTDGAASGDGAGASGTGDVSAAGGDGGAEPTSEER